MELVERETALHVLSDPLAEAVEGRGRLALMSGEAGVGKTALVRRFLHDQAANSRVLIGACDPVVTPRPLGPLVDIAATVGGDLEVLIARGSGTGPVFNALLRMPAATPRPPVVVLEDLHWADEATVDLLCLLGRTPVTVYRARRALVFHPPSSISPSPCEEARTVTSRHSRISLWRSRDRR